MSKTAQHESNERAFCLEIVRRIRPKRLICERFFVDDMSDGRVALSAFLCALEETTESGRDGQVTQAKLAWWYNEMQEEPPRGNQHPIIRRMDRTGVLGRIDRRAIQQAIHLARDRVDRDVIPDLETLGQVCERMGAVELQCEAAVDGHGVLHQPIFQQGARLNGLAQLLRQSLRAPDSGCWWLPLEVSARVGVTRDQPLAVWAKSGADSPFQDLQHVVRSWAPDWASLKALSRALTDSAYLGMSPPGVWAIETALQAHHLYQLGGTSPSGLGGLPGVRPADVLIAWRAARRLRAVPPPSERCSP